MLVDPAAELSEWRVVWVTVSFVTERFRSRVVSIFQMIGHVGRRPFFDRLHRAVERFVGGVRFFRQAHFNDRLSERNARFRQAESRRRFGRREYVRSDVRVRKADVFVRHDEQPSRDGDEISSFEQMG